MDQTPSRLPSSLLVRCLLAFSIGVTLLVPLLGVGLFFWLREEVIPVAKAPRAAIPATKQAEESPALLAPAAAAPTSDRGTPQNIEQGKSSGKGKTSGKGGAVNAQIADMVASSKQQSTEENLNQLDKMSQRLESVASDRSVDDLSSQLRGWMGLKSRASQPQVSGKSTEFDIDSAQLHDVQRVERQPGKFEYSAVLVDARGQTFEIALTEAEGRETYQLMQRIKSNPLLEKVYRQIAMPLLDSLVETARDQMDSSDSDE